MGYLDFIVMVGGYRPQATCSLGPSPKEVAGKGKLASAIGAL